MIKAIAWAVLCGAVLCGALVVAVAVSGEAGARNGPAGNNAVHQPISNPISGTWTLDIAKSHLTQPAPKSEILRVNAEGAIAIAEFDEVTANGEHIKNDTSLHLNGKSYRVEGSTPYGADSISGEQSGANTTDATLRRHGAVVATIRATVSPDGKTATITVNSKQQGKNLNETTVWRRCTSPTCGAAG